MKPQVIIESLKNFTNADQADHVIVNVSGGKDSSVLMQYAIDNFPIHKLHFVHAKLKTDWTVTVDVVEEQAAHFNVEMHYVRGVNKHGEDHSWLDRLTGPRVSRKTGEITQYQWPNNSNRYCTSDDKTGPLDKFARKFRGNVLVLLGERREESPKRNKMEAWRPQPMMSLKDGTRNVVKYSPILDMGIAEVWEIIHDTNIPTHPCYSWGVSRASCAICIFSSNKEIRLAAKHDPEIVKMYLEAEKKIDHTFRYKKTKKDGIVKETLADILAGSDILGSLKEG